MIKRDLSVDDYNYGVSKVFSFERKQLSSDKILTNV